MQISTQNHTRVTAAAMAIMLVPVLAGCASTAPVKEAGSEPMSDPDGVSCADSAGETAVWIDVEYSGDEVSTPSERCEVDPNTRITWRGPTDSRVPFQLRFHAGSPGIDGPRLPGSLYSEGRQKIRITADNHSGEYGYDILTSIGTVDPAIIIRQR